MEEEKIDKILKFLKEIEKYKTIERTHINSDMKRQESDAEHSWHMAMFLLLFSNDLPKNLDFERMLKLTLIHDLPEIYSGDTFAFDEKKREGKKERELESIKKLVSKLPQDLKEEFMELFQEYESQKTEESKIVKALDKIQPLLQGLVSKGHPYKAYNLKYEQVKEMKDKYVPENNFFFSVYKNLLKESKEKIFD